MKKQFFKLTTLCLASTLFFSMSSSMAFAANIIGIEDDYIGGFQSETNKDAKIITIDQDEIVTYASMLTYDENLGIANVETHLNIRKGPGMNYSKIGTLSKNAGCTIIEIDENGWAKIVSGKVTGYVKSEYLYTGDEANKLMQELKNLVATTNTEGVNVRKEPTTLKDNIITTLSKGEGFFVEEETVTNYDEENNKWVKISLDGEDGDNYGYIAKQYVNISWELEKAVAISDSGLEGVSSTRAALVKNAKYYIGGKYVYGGESLTSGIDCSAFVRAIYKMSGYSLPRTSREQAKASTTVSAKNIKPGDLVFYGNNSTGYVNHVAMYIGNGQIVHASNKKSGIKISNMYYKQPIKIGRFIKD